MGNLILRRFCLPEIGNRPIAEKNPPYKLTWNDRSKISRITRMFPVVPHNKIFSFRDNKFLIFPESGFWSRVYIQTQIVRFIQKRTVNINLAGADLDCLSRKSNNSFDEVDLRVFG